MTRARADDLDVDAQSGTVLDDGILMALSAQALRTVRWFAETLVSISRPALLFHTLAAVTALSAPSAVGPGAGGLLRTPPLI
ncbi:hypothetical protein [Streptomyces sp. NPDC056061]|uniref:hypothetical protein n=1 Tax=Streptomyces sp. NPDC056061 TaxID=3345700 RepID=UPI0035D57443